MRLIDADAIQFSNDSVVEFAAQWIIDDQPTVDAEPVTHAHWTSDGCCSRCGWAMATDSADDFLSEDDNHYCYNCGARMDEEAKK